MKGQFLRDHIRTGTHTSVGDVRGFKNIGEGEKRG